MIMRIRELREAKGMTQIQLGTKMGVAQCVISEWEKEVYLPKSRDLPALAAALGCSIGKLFVDETECNDFEEEEESVCRE